MKNEDEPRTPCGLMRLSVELRLMIFKELFHGREIHYGANGINWRDENLLAPLYVNRQISAEAAQCLCYISLQFDSATEMLSRLLPLTPRQRSRFRHITVLNDHFYMALRGKDGLPSHYTLWIDEILAVLPGLRLDRLEVSMYAIEYDAGMNFEDRWARAMMSNGWKELAYTSNSLKESLWHEKLSRYQADLRCDWAQLLGLRDDSSSAGTIRIFIELLRPGRRSRRIWPEVMPGVTLEELREQYGSAIDKSSFITLEARRADGVSYLQRGSYQSKQHLQDIRSKLFPLEADAWLI